MKTHKTIMYTVEMLDKLNPCSSGRASARPFLPAKLSTDPEENIELALELAQADPKLNMTWFATASAEGTVVACDRDYHYDSTGANANRESHRDPFLIAQYLAWIADAIATRDGR